MSGFASFSILGAVRRQPDSERPKVVSLRSGIEPRHGEGEAKKQSASQRLEVVTLPKSKKMNIVKHNYNI